MMIVDNLLKGATLNDTGQRGMHIAPKSYAIRTVHATANPEISSHSDTPGIQSHIGLRECDSLGEFCSAVEPLSLVHGWSRIRSRTFINHQA